MSPEPIRTPGVFAVEPDEPRLQTPRVRPDDHPEATLRPRRLEEFIGQEALREQLGVSIAAAASMLTAICSLTASCPTNSSRPLGRSERSSSSSATRCSGVWMRLIGGPASGRWR